MHTNCTVIYISKVQLVENIRYVQLYTYYVVVTMYVSDIAYWTISFTVIIELFFPS